MTRRRILWLAFPAAGLATYTWWRSRSYHLPATVAAGGGVDKVVRTQAEWQSRLTPQQYYVTRTRATDEPFTGTYHRLHTRGVYRCVCCESALFRSEEKYDSGTGWPAFWQSIDLEQLRIVAPVGITQEAALKSGIEVLCARCDAHLGHIFNDGPEPTGLRYCINESALQFVAG